MSKWQLINQGLGHVQNQAQTLSMVFVYRGTLYAILAVKEDYTLVNQQQCRLSDVIHCFVYSA